MSGDFEALAREAVAGELRIVSSVAEACAAECDRYVQELIALRRRTASIVNVDSFGTLNSQLSWEPSSRSSPSEAPARVR